MIAKDGAIILQSEIESFLSQSSSKVMRTHQHKCATVEVAQKGMRQVEFEKVLSTLRRRGTDAALTDGQRTIVGAAVKRLKNERERNYRNLSSALAEGVLLSLQEETQQRQAEDEEQITFYDRPGFRHLGMESLPRRFSTTSSASGGRAGTSYSPASTHYPTSNSSVSSFEELVEWIHMYHKEQSEELSFLLSLVRE